MGGDQRGSCLRSSRLLLPRWRSRSGPAMRGGREVRACGRQKAYGGARRGGRRRLRCRCCCYCHRSGCGSRRRGRAASPRLASPAAPACPAWNRQSERTSRQARGRAGRQSELAFSAAAEPRACSRALQTTLSNDRTSLRTSAASCCCYC